MKERRKKRADLVRKERKNRSGGHLFILSRNPFQFYRMKRSRSKEEEKKKMMERRYGSLARQTGLDSRLFSFTLHACVIEPFFFFPFFFPVVGLDDVAQFSTIMVNVCVPSDVLTSNTGKRNINILIFYFTAVWCFPFCDCDLVVITFQPFIN